MTKKLPTTVTQISGNTAVDDRGMLKFVNDFDFSGVKRFYQVENFNLNTIRAFHGHMNEGKYVYVIEGSIILCAVKLTSSSNPAKSETVQRLILSSHKPQIVFIPAGFANGFKCLEKKTKVLFFSTSTLEESKGDDYRFSADYWGDSIWEVENR